MRGASLPPTVVPHVEERPRSVSAPPITESIQSIPIKKRTLPEFLRKGLAPRLLRPRRDRKQRKPQRASRNRGLWFAHEVPDIRDQLSDAPYSVIVYCKDEQIHEIRCDKLSIPDTGDIVAVEDEEYRIITVSQKGTRVEVSAVLCEDFL